MPSCPDYYLGPSTSCPRACRARVLPLEQLNHFPSLVLCFLRQCLTMKLRLGGTTHCSSGWPQTSNHPISVTLLLSIGITNLHYCIYLNLFKIWFFKRFVSLLVCFSVLKAKLNVRCMLSNHSTTKIIQALNLILNIIKFICYLLI